MVKNCFYFYYPRLFSPVSDGFSVLLVAVSIMAQISSVLIMSVATVVGLLVSLLVWMELSVVTLSLFHF